MFRDRLSRLRGQRVSRGGIALLLATVTGLLGGGAAYAGPTLAVTTIDGSPVAGSNSVTGSSLAVGGIASGLPAMVVDAGPSLYLEKGQSGTLFGNVVYSVGATTYSWYLDNPFNTAPFSDVHALQPVLNTSALRDGVHTAFLNVTDSRGVHGTATTKVVTYHPVATVLASAKGLMGPAPGLVFTSLPGTNGPIPVGGGTIPPNLEKRVPFDVPAGVSAIDLSLQYDLIASAAGNNVGQFNLNVEDPSGFYSSDQDGATGADPETLHLANPAPGRWYADVVDVLSLTNARWHLTVSTSVPSIADPRPVLSSGGPYAFHVGDVQALKATATGGTSPLAYSWDLAQTGLFSTSGASATSHFGLGSHLVTARVRDGAGYDVRASTAVRVYAVGVTPNNSPLVVVALADTGINPYHQEFGATTFPDAGILARSNNFTANPATYVPGYPAGTPSLPVHLDQGYDPPVDQPIWASPSSIAKLNTLYWIPGTKIIGALDSGLGTGATGATNTPSTILDTNGHGTASASVLAGNTLGTCGQCLLVAIKGLGGETWAYNQPWIDIVSNSYGAIGNVGEAGLIAPVFPAGAAQRGQLAFYAAGNGYEDAFVTPEQTYTSDTLGPDWVVRVGAVDRSTNQPFLGTGKPVTVSSYGLGNIPAADFASTNGQVQHNGTSAATPITAGVFAATLAAIRNMLGDAGVGQRGGHGIIASGSAIPSSPYLKDGVLTRSELVEAVTHTAETGTETGTIEFPETTPGNPFQYAIEGYGIVNTASGLRAQQVLLGQAPLPKRPNEDQFFGIDGQIRDALWGTWAGGGANSAHGGTTEPDGAVSGPNPYRGTTFAQVSTFPKALRLMQTHSAALAGPDPSKPSVTLTTPTNGLATDPGATSLDVAGKASFPATSLPGTPTTFYLRRDACGASQTGSQNPYLARTPQPAPAQANDCGSLLDPLALLLGVAGPVFGLGIGDDYAMQPPDVPAILGSGNVSGTVTMTNTTPSPVTSVDFALVSGGTALADQTVTQTIVTPNSSTPFNFSFPVPAAAVGISRNDLHLVVTVMNAQTTLGTELVNPPSFVSIPLAPSTVPVGAAVQLSIDDATFASPTTVAINPDLTFSATLSLSGLAVAPATHVLYARPVVGTAPGNVSSASFQITPAGAAPPVVLGGTVQVQLIPAGGLASPTGWSNASDTTATGSYSTWSANLDLTAVAPGDYTLLTQILLSDGSTVAGSPVSITRS
jgi:hypothetical protein